MAPQDVLVRPRRPVELNENEKKKSASHYVFKLKQQVARIWLCNHASSLTPHSRGQKRAAIKRKQRVNICDQNPGLYQ